MSCLCGGGSSTLNTGVCEKRTPFTRALAMRPSSRNCNPAPDSVFLSGIIIRKSVCFSTELLSGRLFVIIRYSYPELLSGRVYVV